MPEELTSATTADSTAGADSADVAIPNDEASLSEHEAAFGPVDPSLEGEARDKAEATKQSIRHRAKSQQAKPDDVAEIQQWSARARAAEDAAGIERKPNESERVYRLRVRAELAERHGKPAPQQQQQAPPQQRQAELPPAPKPHPPQPAAAEPTRAKPNEDEVGTGKYATYAEFVEDLADWKSEQRDAARQKESQDRDQQAQTERGQQEWNKAHEDYRGRLAKFVETHQDYERLLAEHRHINLPPAAYQAVVTHEQGPAFVYHLLQHPDQLTEMLLLMDGKPATAEYVAHATRWLTSRVQAGITGSVGATPPRSVGPRPPNPVRTGSHSTGEEVPGDDSSLAEHEHAFGKRRARR